MARRMLAILGSALLVLYAASAAESSGPAAVRVAVRQGRLSVDLDRAPLGRVLAEVARQGGVMVFLDPSLENVEITARFRGLALDQGLKRICRDRSYAMVFSTVPGRDERLTALRVYPKGRPEPERYLYLGPGPDRGPGHGPLLQRNQVEALVAVQRELDRSAAARRIMERRRPRPRGNTPGPATPLERTLDRTRRLRRFRLERARTLARRAAYRTQLRIERERMEQARRRSAWRATSRADHASPKP